MAGVSDPYAVRVTLNAIIPHLINRSMADERVVPGSTDIYNVCKHISRYTLALQLCQGQRVLDIACGVGYGSQMLSWVAREVVGVDISQDALKEAVKRFDAPNITYIPSSLEGYIVQDKFDVVVSFETAEHIAELGNWEKRMRQYISRGGFVIYSVPLNEDPGFNEHHYHTFTLDSGLALLPDFTTINSFIQKGITFLPAVPENATEKFSYLIVVKQMPK